MDQFPKKPQQKLDTRKANNALRQLGSQNNLVDFASNDYLGFSKNKAIFNNAHQYLIANNITQNGATGSRLLSGNHSLYNIVEKHVSDFHNSESALIFNSGYDANVGFFSSVPQRGDVILYDEYIHASIRDGIKLSNAQAYKFKHNDLNNLVEMLKRVQHDKQDIYIVTESVFSMDGDSPDLVKMCQTAKKHNTYLIVDEAHAVGVFGKNGCGLVQQLGLENNVFARLVTFGKALGCHGAAILGSETLKQYLANFARSFIYTTGLPPHSLATIQCAYKALVTSSAVEKSHQNIQHFKSEVKRLQFKLPPPREMLVGKREFIESQSTIQCCVVPGNENVKQIAKQLRQNGFDVKAILSPTIPKNHERLRFCLHAYNSKEEITEVLELLSILANI